MAYVTIQGRNDKLSKDETQRAIDFFGKHLMGRLYNHIDIEVDFIAMRVFWGRCGVISVEKSKYRDFGMEISNLLCRKNQLLTIAHEMVHIKQFARGEFDDLGGTKFKWKSKIFTNVEYATAPWELEAYKMEKELYALYEGKR
jgi:hypothetical protein